MIGTLSHRHGPYLRHLHASALVALISRVVALARWRQRAKERRQLAAFDDRLLRDIGLTRLDAMRECGKPFWRA